MFVFRCNYTLKNVCNQSIKTKICCLNSSILDKIRKVLPEMAFRYPLLFSSQAILVSKCLLALVFSRDNQSVSSPPLRLKGSVHRSQQNSEHTRVSRAYYQRKIKDLRFRFIVEGIIKGKLKGNTLYNQFWCRNFCIYLFFYIIEFARNRQIV